MKLSFAKVFCAIWIALFLASNALAQSTLFSVVSNPQLTQEEQTFLTSIQQQDAIVAWYVIQANQELLKNGDSFAFPLLDNSNVVDILTKTNLAYRTDTDFSWFGKVEGKELASINFVNNKGFVHGLYISTDAVYEIQPISRTHQVLIIRDQSLYPKEGCHNLTPRSNPGEIPPAQPIPVKEEGEDRGTPESLAGNCNVRLLVCYTDDVGTANADPVGHIQLATDNYNATSNNSNVFHRVEIARIVEVSYAETGDDGTDLSRLSGSADGFMDNIHSLRDWYDADMVCLITMTLDGCGLADDIGATSTTAFQVTKYSCATGNLTFAHEFGHLLNARHDHFVDNTAGSNHGYVYIPGNWRTCMSYNDACENAGTSCTRIQRWSNPSLTYSGVATGVSGANGSNNRSAIDAYDNTVAAFQPYITAKTFSIADNINDDEVGHLLAQNTLSTSIGQDINFNSGSIGTYRAGTSVTLNEGFWAKTGTDFTALLDNCTNPFFTDPDPPTDRNEQASLQNRASASLKMYPNPVKHQVNITYQVVSSGSMVLEILDVNGRLLQTLFQTNTHDAGAFRLNQDLSMLGSGTYFLRLRETGRTESIPFVKVNN